MNSTKAEVKTLLAELTEQKAVSVKVSEQYAYTRTAASGAALRSRREAWQKTEKKIMRAIGLARYPGHEELVAAAKAFCE